MSQTSNPFEELLVGLARAGVDFITVGGIACAFNGHVRATEDVDILIRRNPENVRKLLSFLSTYGEGFGRELEEKDFTDEEGAVRVIEEFPIDIFVVMGGCHYEDLLKSVRTVEIGRCAIPYLDRDGLIRLKKDSVREKDRLDVAHLTGLKDS